MWAPSGLRTLLDVNRYEWNLPYFLDRRGLRWLRWRNFSSYWIEWVDRLPREGFRLEEGRRNFHPIRETQYISDVVLDFCWTIFGSWFFRSTDGTNQGGFVMTGIPLHKILGSTEKWRKVIISYIRWFSLLKSRRYRVNFKWGINCWNFRFSI